MCSQVIGLFVMDNRELSVCLDLAANRAWGIGTVHEGCVNDGVLKPGCERGRSHIWRACYHDTQ